VVKLSANTRRTGRSRKKDRGQSVAELQDTGQERKAPQQKVEGPAEIESDKEKVESELKSSEPETVLPELLGAQRQTVEQARDEPAEHPKQADVKPVSEQKSGGKRVADKESAFDSFTKINESVFSLDAVKKAAAWYIETSEKLAHQALELQEKATGWAKDTPFAPLFEAQHSMARKFVERSANAARTLWQIQPNQ